MTDYILEIDGVSKRFGGLMANADISFYVERGQIVGIVGPNGAGKTTLFNCISRMHSLTTGTIIFDGVNITTKTAYQACKKGIGRTFQITQSLNEMYVWENVLVASLCQNKMTQALLRTEEILEEIGLTPFRNMLAGSLNVVQKKRLEIARALACEPKLLLLDETMAGLTGIERKGAIQLIHAIRAKGITILMIEHVMEVVMNVSDKIVVLNGGKLLMEGTPNQVAQNEEVISAYLGGVKW